MAFNNWNLSETTGDGSTKDTIGQGQAGYEVVISSIWIVNNSGAEASVELLLTDSANDEYFKITRTLADGEDIVANTDGNGAVFLTCLNNQDKLKIVSDQVEVSVVVSKDETYAGTG